MSDPDSYVTPLAIGHFRECEVNKSFSRFAERRCNCRELSGPGGLFVQRLLEKQREQTA